MFAPRRQPWQKPGRRHWRHRRPGTALYGSAGGEHIVDQDKPLADHRRPTLLRHFECALDVAGALGARQADLRSRRLDAFQRTGGDRHPTFHRDGGGEHGRLVEAPSPLPPPMQRHRHQRVSLRKQFAARIADPAPHHRRQIKAVAIFEGVDKGARNLVEPHRRTRPVIDRGLGDRLHRQDTWAGVVHERDAQPFAIGPRDEGELRPARRAEPLALDRRPTHGTELRQGDVERCTQKRAHDVCGSSDARRHSEICRHRHVRSVPPGRMIVIGRSGIARARKT
jgi:hypothetical protein